jgi:hypothetical protein
MSEKDSWALKDFYPFDDFSFCSDWIFSKNSFFMILRERKKEMTTETNIPNIE